MSINTLAAARALEKTGMPEKQAEALVEIIREGGGEGGGEGSEWRGQTDNRLDKIDSRFDRMDSRFDKIESRLSRLEQDMAEVKTRGKIAVNLSIAQLAVLVGAILAFILSQ